MGTGASLCRTPCSGVPNKRWQMRRRYKDFSEYLVVGENQDEIVYQLGWRNKSNASLRIGRRLKMVRVAREVRLCSLAEQMLVSPQTLKRYENGKTMIPALQLWLAAQALNTPMEVFFADFPQDVTDECMTETVAPENNFLNQNKSTKEMSELVWVCLLLKNSVRRE